MLNLVNYAASPQCQKNISIDELYKFYKTKLRLNQFASQKNRWAVNTFLLFLDTVKINSDDEQVLELTLLYISFATTFDNVCHHLLLHKLMEMEDSGKNLRLLKLYLEKRKQFVK